MNTNSIMLPFSLLCSLNSWLVNATVLIQSACKLPQHYFMQWTLTPSCSLSLCYVRLTHDLWMLLFWFNQPVSYLSIISCNLWWTLDSVMIPFSLLCLFNSLLVDATVLIQSDRKLPQHFFMQWTLDSIMLPFSLLCSFNTWLVDANVLIQSESELLQHYFMQFIWTLNSNMIPLSLLCLFNTWLVDVAVLIQSASKLPQHYFMQ